MISKRYKIANQVIEINSIYEDVHAYCAEYQTGEMADFKVSTTEQDIAYERLKYEKEYHQKIEKRYGDGYLEELAVYRKIAEKMIDYHTILFHGSVVEVDGKGYLFTAKSGTGKSTHARLWCEYLGEKAHIVNDDKPLLNISDSITAYGTPYNGKHRIGLNTSVPLKAICIIHQASENHIERISSKQAYPMLIQQVYRPENKAKMQETLQLIDKLVAGVEFYQLGCNKDISAAKLSYEKMR